jgi:hypothetical protein
MPFDWLSPLCRSLSCGAAFRAALHRDLGRELDEALGRPGRDGFVLRLADGARVRETDGTVRVEVYISCPDAIALPAEIGWRCDAHPGEHVDPADANAIERGCAIAARWISLPQAALADRYARPLTVERELFSFVVETWPLSWPYVFLELDFAADVPDAALAEVDRVLLGVFDRWNAQSDAGNDHGTIHNMHRARRLDARCLEVSIDFGSADWNALAQFLVALNGWAGGHQLAKLVVRGYAAPTPPSGAAC